MTVSGLPVTQDAAGATGFRNLLKFLVIRCTSRPNSNQGAVVRGYYCDFLHSPYWRALRRQVLARQSDCERCGSRVELQVHHQGYEALGTAAEYYDHVNLEVLCRRCHCSEHGLPIPLREPSELDRLLDSIRRWQERAA